MKTRLFFAFFAALTLLGTGWVGLQVYGSNPAGPPVGLRMLKFAYAGLPSPVDGAVWYPAVRGSRERMVWYSSAVWGHASLNAAEAKGQKHPLVILAHGWRGTRFDLQWVGEALAQQGYVVASVQMPLVDAKTFDNAQGPKVWYRASLLKSLIDAVAADKELSADADTSHVVAVGHSAGGSAAFMLGGATLDASRFASLFPLSAPTVAGVWSDPRLAGIVALNPGTGPAFAPSGLRSVGVPALIVSGTGDHVAPEASNAGYYARNVPQAQWISLPNVDHYTFMPECSFYGLWRGFSTCRESHAGVQRHMVHAQTLGAIEHFLQALPLGAHRPA